LKKRRADARCEVFVVVPMIAIGAGYKDEVADKVTDGAKGAGAKTAHPSRSEWQSRSAFFRLQSDSGGRDEHLFLPKALAVLDPFSTAPLVGSEKAANASRED
jgi:hypothetical protein